MPTTQLVIEGIVDEAVSRAVARYCGCKLGPSQGFKGKGWIDKNIQAFGKAAAANNQQVYFVVRDFDGDEQCPGQLRKKLLAATGPKNLVFRMAVGAIESWLLADVDGISAWLNVDAKHLPGNVDSISDPKQFLMDLDAKRRRRGKAIFYDEGDYATRVIEFANKKYSVERALKSKRSQSLQRATQRLTEALKT